MTQPGLEDFSGWPFVKTAFVFDVVDSTNNRAAELVRGGESRLPLVVWARTQTRGRGRGTHEWWSDAGSLTLTLAIDPTEHGLRADDEPKLALATAVAVIQALHDLGLGHPSLGIRWPNDIEVTGRKLGGILPERIETMRGHRILIGIGLNVWTDLTHAPPLVNMMAASVASIATSHCDEETLRLLIPAILGRLDLALNRLVAGDASLAADWRRLDLLRDTWIRVELGSRVIAGVAREIDASGCLCIMEGPDERRIMAGQVLRDHRPLR